MNKIEKAAFVREEFETADSRLETSHITANLTVFADHLRVSRGLKFSNAWIREQWKELHTLTVPEHLEREVEESLAAAEPEKPLFSGQIEHLFRHPTIAKGERFILTAAQNNTPVNQPFFNALLGMAKDRDAQLMVSRFVYNKNGFQNGVKDTENQNDIWFDPQITPYITDERIQLADDLHFCGELNILPTAPTPLNTLRSYTGRNSCIVPHAKMQLVSVATPQGEDAKLMYTTGTVTQRNYIEKRVGQVADFNHVFGAIYVEIDELGRWFARQIMADNTGGFQELTDYYAADGTIYRGMSVDAYVPGDIHVEVKSPWAIPSIYDITDVLKPSHVFWHDIYDFQYRNHHNLSDPYFMAAHQASKVAWSLKQAKNFLHTYQYAFPDVEQVVVRSNHDQALERWLRDPKGFLDPVNAYYWCELNAYGLRQVECGLPPEVIPYAIRNADTPGTLNGVKFLDEDERYVLNGVDYGFHGHRGPNGARGSIQAFRGLGFKAFIAHSHTAGILDGVWQVGVNTLLKLGYTHGPSSWTHTDGIMYPNGKRCLITKRGTSWKA